MGDMTKNFNRAEFACKCGCGFDNINPMLVEKLQSLRNACDFPLVITSGCRCQGRNQVEGGKEDSAHLTGKAADIKCTDSRSRFEILHWAIMFNFNRIGIGDTFIHLDIDSTKPQNVIWVY